MPEEATAVARPDFKKWRLAFDELGWTIIYPFELRVSAVLLIQIVCSQNKRAYTFRVICSDWFTHVVVE
ncbi:hypothetical protein KUL156_12100 [Alteromonas sp. KUL156]|nr:hypothetical protein KUL106_10570 [Alteromonas sp. KUL106]GFD98617.1 hypothetical protein KUL156_12100 [Alteromonas sp. KUL156]